MTSTAPSIQSPAAVVPPPRISRAVNAGHDMVDQLAPAIEEEKRTANNNANNNDVLDMIIVGAGAAGLAAAARANDRRHQVEFGLKSAGRWSQNPQPVPPRPQRENPSAAEVHLTLCVM